MSFPRLLPGGRPAGREVALGPGARVAAEPVVADVAPVTSAPVATAAVAAPAPDVTIARLAGTWEGTGSGRPFTVACARAGGAGRGGLLVPDPAINFPEGML